MFPSDEAKDINSMNKDELKNIRRVVLIDSTWSQTKYYLRQDILSKMKHVKIQTEKTCFWRYQKGEADTALATIEALYFFFRDYETTLNHKHSYDEYYKAGGKWDNLMYLYAFQFKMIQDAYKNGKLDAQPFRRIPGYIKYDDGDKCANR